MSRNKIYTIIMIIFSIICGIISHDYYLGTSILICGLLNVYYASIGKTYNYIFGALYCLLSAYVCYQNGLFAMAVLSLIVYFPLQIQGYISWLKKKDNNHEVKVRRFTFKYSLIIVSTCIIGSFLLTKIPKQQLAFLDSSSNIINLWGIILMNLRFQECWIVWVFYNTIDVIIWAINTINGNTYAVMMLIASICYFVINIYGLLKWYKASNKNIIKL